MLPIQTFAARLTLALVYLAGAGALALSLPALAGFFPLASLLIAPALLICVAVFGLALSMGVEESALEREARQRQMAAARRARRRAC